MKIAFTTDYTWPSGGGVERVIHEVGSRLAKRGHEVTVVTLGRPGEVRRDSNSGMEIVRVPGIDMRRLTGLAVSAPRSRALLAEVARADVVSAHNLYFGTTLMAGLWATPPVVLSLHVDGFDGAGAVLAPAVRAFEATLGRTAVRRAARVTGVSPGTVARAMHLGANAAIEIPNGLDADHYSPNGVHERTGCVFVGRLANNKGPHVLLEAWRSVERHHPEARLDFVGGGPMRARLERRAVRLRLRSVRFHGQVDDIRPFLQRAALYARPSLTDGLPLTVMEAQGCGAAVAASAVAGNLELVSPGLDGVLVEPGNVASWTRHLVALLEDPERLRQMGRHGRAQAVGRLDWETVAQRYLTVFEEVAG